MRVYRPNLKAAGRSPKKINPSLTIGVNKLDIDECEIGHLFINGKYFGVNRKARALLADELVLDESWNRKISDGDRIAIFPKRMGVFMC